MLDKGLKRPRRASETAGARRFQAVFHTFKVMIYHIDPFIHPLRWYTVYGIRNILSYEVGV